VIDARIDLVSCAGVSNAGSAPIDPGITRYPGFLSDQLESVPSL